MFCPNCGNSSTSGAKFCENCGTSLPLGQQATPMDQQYAQAPPPYQAAPQYQAAPPYGQPMYGPVPMKSTGIAVILAVLVPGLGHIYLGRIGEGIMYLILAFVFGALIILLIGFILLPILWIWQIYDAYNKANQYNAAVQQTGRAPW